MYKKANKHYNFICRKYYFLPIFLNAILLQHTIVSQLTETFQLICKSKGCLLILIEHFISLTAFSAQKVENHSIFVFAGINQCDQYEVN